VHIRVRSAALHRTGWNPWSRRIRYRTLVPYSPSVAVLSIETFSHVVHYMRHQQIEKFRLLNDFAQVLGDVTIAIIRTAQSPESFTVAFSKNWLAPAEPRLSPAECLAASIQLGKYLFGRRIVDLSARGRSPLSSTYQDSALLTTLTRHWDPGCTIHHKRCS
jgi:hypothetical protein